MSKKNDDMLEHVLEEEDFNIDFLDFDVDLDNLNEEVYAIEKDKSKQDELVNTIEEKASQIQQNQAITQFKRDNNTSLSEKQLNAIDLYINGENKTQIAKRVGVTRATVINWFKKDEFIHELEEREKERDTSIYHNLISYVPKSVKVITQMIEDNELSAKDRLRAISMLWDATGFSKKQTEDTVKQQTIININPEFAPNKKVVNNMVERVIEEDEEDTTKNKDDVIDV